MPKLKARIFELSAAYVEILHRGLESTTPLEAHRTYRNPSLLDSAVRRPFQTAFGQDIHPSLIEKAAAPFHSLIANHPFHDGNKRTAVLALDQFLLANGLYLGLSQSEIYTLAIETASYRERGLGHQEILEQLNQKLSVAVLPISALRRDPALKAHYSPAKEMRNSIRRHKLNRTAGRARMRLRGR